MPRVFWLCLGRLPVNLAGENRGGARTLKPRAQIAGGLALRCVTKAARAGALSRAVRLALKRHDAAAPVHAARHQGDGRFSAGQDGDVR